MAILVSLFALALLAACVFADGGSFFVAPEGDDRGDGTCEKPFASPARARDAIRDLRKQGKLTAGTGATVFLRGGIYCLPDGLSFGEADSGTAEAPIVWRSWGDREVRLVGGVVIPPDAFRPVSDPQVLARLDEAVRGHVLVADLSALDVRGLEPWPDYSRGAGETMELFFDGLPATVARWPKEGWSIVAGIIDPESDDRQPDRPTNPGGFFYGAAEDRPRRWTAAENVYVSGYFAYDWGFDTCRVASIDPATKAVRLAAPSTYGFTNHGDRRYFFQNILEELGSPGEYYVDAARGLLYFYPPGRIGPASCVLSTARGALLTFSGASHIRFEGLTLEASRGHGVAITEGEAVAIRRCVIRNTGLAGVQIEGGRQHRVAGCEIHHTGSNGAVLSGGDRNTLTPAGHEAVDNHFHHFSRLQRCYSPAIHLLGVGNRAAHNLMHDAPHTVVQYHGNDLVIEFNEIHSVCEETGDVGVIGTGRDWAMHGCVVRHNYIHHIGGLGPVGAVAIYVDDLGSGVEITGNIVYQCQRAFLIGGGRWNRLTNNIVVDCPVHIQLDSRALNWTPFFAEEGNVLRTNLAKVPYQSQPWASRWPQLAKLLDDQPAWPKYNVFRNNALCRTAPIWVAKEVYEVSDVGGNFVTDADLGFTDAPAGDLSLRPDSPVFRELPDFTPIPFDQIGPRPT